MNDIFMCTVICGTGITVLLDYLVTSSEAIEDENGNIIGYKSSNYKSIFDYLKKRYKNKIKN